MFFSSFGTSILNQLNFEPDISIFDYVKLSSVSFPTIYEVTFLSEDFASFAQTFDDFSFIKSSPTIQAFISYIEVENILPSY